MSDKTKDDCLKRIDEKIKDLEELKRFTKSVVAADDGDYHSIYKVIDKWRTKRVKK